jgi:biotin synthase
MNPLKNNAIDLLLELPLAELILEADKTRRKFIGNRIELCSIINAKSGGCSEDCKFCAQSSRYSTNISTFSLKNKSQIVAAAREAKEIGADKFGVVTSGNRLTSREVDVIAGAVREINDEVGIKVCASLGTLEKSQLERLSAAGLSRYHHNLETSGRFYPRIVSTHSFKERINTIIAAKEVGLEVCSGGIIGMGELWSDRIELAVLLRDLNVDSVPINFLIPIKGTPLESIKPISSSAAIRTICIFRIILKDKIIKIAAGRETVLSDFQGLGFMAGACGMLIGGYLTVKGRDVALDRELVKAVKELWTE